MSDTNLMPKPPSRRSDLDDWLGDDGDLEWADTAEQTVQLPRQTPRAPAAGAAAGAEQGRDLDLREELYHRRRIIALGAIAAAIIVAIIVAIVAFGGSGKKTTPPPTTTPVNTTPVNTNPVTTPTTTPTTTPVTPVTTVTLPASGSLRSGDTGAEVKTLQQALTALQLDPGKADGSFGPSTEKAVIAFQKQNNLAQDGVVGKATADKINAQLTSG